MLQQTCINKEDVEVGGDVGASQQPHQRKNPGCYVGIRCCHCNLTHNVKPPWSKCTRISKLHLPALVSNRTYVVGLLKNARTCAQCVHMV